MMEVQRRIKQLRKRLFKTYTELWNLTLDEVQRQEPEMPRDLLRTIMRASWTDGTLRTDEDQDFLTTFEEELKSAWEDVDTLRGENAAAEQRIAVLEAGLNDVLRVVRQNCLDMLEAEARKYTDMGHPNLDAQDRAVYAEVMAALEAAAEALAVKGGEG